MCIYTNVIHIYILHIYIYIRNIYIWNILWNIYIYTVYTHICGMPASHKNDISIYIYMEYINTSSMYENAF